MAVYILSVEKDVIAFDATTSTNYSVNDSLSKNSVMSGAQVSDNTQIGNPQVTFTGLVSYSKIRDFAPTPKELLDRVEELRLSRTRFTLYGDTKIPTLQDCVFTSFTLEDSTYSDGVMATLTVEQVNVTNAARVTSIKEPTPSSGTNGQLASETDKGEGTKTKEDDEKAETLFKDLVDSAIETFGGSVPQENEGGS